MGFIRIGLALMIMAGHLGPPLILRWWPAMAVIFFYALSGYLATLVFIETYKSKAMPFLVARIARLYPCYIAVLLITAAILLMIGPSVHIPVVPLPINVRNGIEQLLMIVRYPSGSRIVPSAWMLKWLIVGYGLIALGISKSAKTTWVWLMVSLLATVWLSLGISKDVFYGSFALASLSMSAGSSGYWTGIRFPRDGRIAAICGGLSYPLFLCHLSIGAALNMPRSWPLFFAALPPTLALSWLLWRFIEVPVDRYRNQ